MGTDKIIVLVAGIGLIGLIAWWFFAKRRNDAVVADISNNRQTVNITVDGGYTPNTITLKKGVPADLMFLRKDPSGCLEEVVFPDFGISKKLPLNKTEKISLTPEQVGEFKYACGMNMFFGKVLVK